MVVVSIIGIDGLQGGYSVAKAAHEKAALAGSAPGADPARGAVPRVRRPALDWSTQGEIGVRRRRKTQLVAARSVAEVMVDLATDASPADDGTRPFLEVAGPTGRALHRRGHPAGREAGPPRKVESAANPDDPDADATANGALLPGPDAILAGPTFEEWLETAEV